MNAVEIEQAISDLAGQPFDAAEFPFAFLAAFGNKDTTLRRLRAGNSSASDVPGGVLRRNNIHIAACPAGATGQTLAALRVSPATTKAKARFILTADGQTLEAEDLIGGETLACAYTDLPDHFGFLLPLAGISTIKEIKDNPIDVRATSRLNKRYVELLRENPDWATDARRADMKPSPRARTQRRNAGAHLHRSPLQERHRAAGKAVRAVHQDDRQPEAQAES